jgi:hypothetical protein
MRWVLALWELSGPSREFFNEQQDLKSVDYKAERRVDGKCKVKTVMTLDNRAENSVKECGVKRNRRC